MISSSQNLGQENTGAEYRDIQRLLRSAACASGGIGLLTPLTHSPMSGFCLSKDSSSARVLRTRIRQFVQSSGPMEGFYSLRNEKIMFAEAFVPSVVEAVEATFWISAFARLRGEENSTFETVVMSFFIGLISLACGAMFVAIVSSALKLHRMIKTFIQVQNHKKKLLEQTVPQATNMRSAFAKAKGLIALKALEQVDRGYRKLRSQMISSFVVNMLITLAFCALLASAVIAAFFFGAASVGLMGAFFGCLGGGLGVLAIGVIVGIVSSICQRRYKQEAARCIQRGTLYALVLEQMHCYPKDFFKDAVSKSVVALHLGDFLEKGKLSWEEMPSMTACLGSEGRDAQVYSFISKNPLDVPVSEFPYPNK